MAQDRDTGSTDEPENSSEGRGPETKRDGDAEQTSVELRCSGAQAADLQVCALELANAIHAANDEEDDEQEQEVGEEAVDAEHDEDDGIIAGEVAQVVVDPALDFGEIGRLGDALKVEELGDRS